MPTHTLKRIWCKTCNEFTLHSQPFDSKELICRECDTHYTDIYLNEIPREKLLEQRQRYKNRKKERMNRILGGYLFTPDLFGLALEEEIYESDAGQIRLDEIEREERNKIYEERRKQREAEKEEEKKFRNLGRNDICLCGSGKKYKHCCWSRIQKIQR